MREPSRLRHRPKAPRGAPNLWRAWKRAVALGALALISTAGVALGSTRIVMIAGDHAPDGNGVFSSTSLSVGGLNATGQVAFAAQLVGTSNGFSDNMGIFRGDGAMLSQIVRIGQTAPAAASGAGAAGVFLALGTPALNNAGQVAFPAILKPVAGGASTGLFRGSGTPESLVQIAGQGETVPDGNGTFGMGYTSVPPTLNSAGQVAFNAQLQNATNRLQDNGVFRGDGLTMTQLARGGYAAGGGEVFGVLSSGPVLNDAGAVAFGSSLFSASNLLASSSAMVLVNGGATTLYARAGQSTPDGNGTFLGSPTAPCINQAGQVAFVTPANGVVGSYHALYLGNGASLVEIARTGQTLPGFTNQTLEQFEWVNLNNAGQVAFTAISCCTAGIFRWDPASGSVVNLVLKGQAAPDGNGVIDILYSSVDSPVELNDSGQIAFACFVVGGTGFSDYGIFFHDDGLGLLQVARYGDALLGSTITRLGLAIGASKANLAGSAAGRELSPINNLGQVAYSFGLADGRTGVAIWSVSQLRMTAVQLVGNDVQVSWNATGGQTNVLQASAKVPGGFTDISGNIVIPGTGQVATNFVEHSGATNPPARFYRVRLAP